MSTYFLATRMNRQITFMALSDEGREADGSPKEQQWADFAATWAEVISIGGEEGRLAAADNMQVRYRITLRYREDIDPSMRIRLQSGKVLAVRSIRDPDNRGVVLEINALESQGAIDKDM